MEALWPGRGHLGRRGIYVGNLPNIIFLIKRTPGTVFLKKDVAAFPQSVRPRRSEPLTVDIVFPSERTERERAEKATGKNREKQ